MEDYCCHINPAMECITFDLQKTLPLPKIPTGIIFHRRQIWLYNCGIHSAKAEKGFCYVWTENQAGKGSQEVASCLIRHIKEHCGPDVRRLELWSDSCGGQNRNQYEDGLGSKKIYGNISNHRKNSIKFSGLRTQFFAKWSRFRYDWEESDKDWKNIPILRTITLT